MISMANNTDWTTLALIAGGGFLLWNSGILQNLGSAVGQVGGAVGGAVSGISSDVQGATGIISTVETGVNNALSSFFGGVQNFLSPQGTKYPTGTTSYATIGQLQSSVMPTQVGGGYVAVPHGTPSSTVAYYTPIQNSSGLAMGSSILKDASGKIIGGYTPAIGSTYATVKK